MVFDTSTPDDISDKEKLARAICGVTVAFFATKSVNVIFNAVKAYQGLDDLIDD